jgi:hypothetical protein
MRLHLIVSRENITTYQWPRAALTIYQRACGHYVQLAGSSAGPSVGHVEDHGTLVAVELQNITWKEIVELKTPYRLAVRSFTPSLDFTVVDCCRCYLDPGHNVGAITCRRLVLEHEPKAMQFVHVLQCTICNAESSPSSPTSGTTWANRPVPLTCGGVGWQSTHTPPL